MEKSYDRTTGYSPLENVDSEKMRQVIRVVKAILVEHSWLRPRGPILVAGAGRGDEAGLIAEEFGRLTVGADLNIVNKLDSFPEVRAAVSFQKHDLLALGLKNDTFSMIYCYHVLEHVGNPLNALREMQRVLAPGGALFIGFPNRRRLFSYVGTSQKASVMDKLKWNLNDYWYRLRGKFENRYGAHAGYTEKEFMALALQLFPVVHPVRDEYMLKKYARYSDWIMLFVRNRLGEFLFPSNYYVCIKK